jgi:hypothetical protein
MRIMPKKSISLDLSASASRCKILRPEAKKIVRLRTLAGFIVNLKWKRPRLGELVDQEFFDRQAAAPAVAIDPEIENLLTY